MPFSLGEYQDIFLEEADELLQDLNKNLLALEKSPDDEDIINNIFRAAHSLKSSAAFVGLNDLSDLAHKMENLLQGIRDKTNSVTPEVVDVIFKCFDVISEVIEMVSSGNEPTRDLKPLIEQISIVNESSGIGPGKPSDSVEEKKVPSPAGTKKTRTSFTLKESSFIKDALAEGLDCLDITVTIEESAQMKWVKAQLISVNLEKDGDVVKIIPSVDDMSSDESIFEFKVILLTRDGLNVIYKACDIDQIDNISIRRITQVQKNGNQVLKIGSVLGTSDDEDSMDSEPMPALPAEVNPLYEEDEHEADMDESDDVIFDRRMTSSQVENDRRKAPILKTVKVSVDKLDLLLNNVGELVIANSGFYRLYDEIRKYTDNKSIISEFKNRMEQMSRIAKDLQTGIMKTRMVPIGQVFSRFNRLARDLAKEHGKKVELVIKGEDTELDKKVIDVIGEPLMHLIRNAVDHGIEPAAERLQQGKAEVATVTLNAYQGGNQIFVEISDDGRGLDLAGIKAKVVEKNMSTPEILANMEDADIYNFIFSPGFSTAKVISDISGRGVGMNVVSEIVNELNGSVSIETEVGMGTRFILTFPLTLAIIPAIMVKVRNEVYAIPLSDVIETIKISYADIATIEGHEVINLRGEILSLLRLNEFVGLKSSLDGGKKIPVVVVGYGNRKIGLIVDFLEGKMEIVIKSLDQNYTTVEGLAGASILGDGSICLILDIQKMINRVITQQERLTQEERELVMKARFADYDKTDDFEAESEETSEPETVNVEAADAADSEAKSGKPNYISDVILFDEEKSPADESVLPREDVIVFEEPKEEPSAEVTPKVEESAAVLEHEGDAETAVIPDEGAGAAFTEEAANDNAVSEMEVEVEMEDVSADEVSGADAEAAADDEVLVNGAVELEIDAEIQSQVQNALDEFKDELKSNISAAVQDGSSSSHIEDELNITKDEINEFNLISNMGAAIAAESLSRILSKRIDLSIPEVKLSPVEKIPEFLGNLNDPYMGVMMGIEGEINGTLLFILEENVGYQLIDMLYGTTSQKEKDLSEDGVSALKELTNIIGSSILNVYAEKSNLIVKPNVPTFVHDYLQSVVDSILVMHNIEHDYAIVMDTAFYFEDDRVMGNLMILPEAESLKLLVSGIKANV